jgi:hypothetical protein
VIETPLPAHRPSVPFREAPTARLVGVIPVLLACAAAGVLYYVATGAAPKVHG